MSESGRSISRLTHPLRRHFEMDTHLHQGQRNGGGGINDAAAQAMPPAIGVKSSDPVEAGAIVTAEAMDDQPRT